MDPPPAGAAVVSVSQWAVQPGGVNQRVLLKAGLFAAQVYFINGESAFFSFFSFFGSSGNAPS